MSFALCPDNGPPRLWRFVAAGTLGYIGGKPIISILLDGNILMIDKDMFDSLVELDRHQLLRTHNNFTVAIPGTFTKG